MTRFLKLEPDDMSASFAMCGYVDDLSRPKMRCSCLLLVCDA